LGSILVQSMRHEEVSVRVLADTLTPLALSVIFGHSFHLWDFERAGCEIWKQIHVAWYRTMRCRCVLCPSPLS
jgi:hypothetical protein